MNLYKITKGISLEELELKMRPKDDYDWGMLGKNESLLEIINSDEKTMKRIGIEYEDLSSKIDKLMYNTEADSLLKPPYRCIGEMTCGFKSCPWDDEFDDEQFYCLLLDKANNEHNQFLKCLKKACGHFPSNKKFKEFFTNEPVIIVSGMMPHLIRDHHFFEGRETVYRCDPEQISRYLGMIK